MSTPWWNVGPGIQAAMKAAADTPAGPSAYKNYDRNLRLLPDPVPAGATVVASTESVWGSKGFYRADNFRGSWRVSGPLTGRRVAPAPPNPTPPPGPGISIAWIGSPNFGSRYDYAPRAIVVHTMSGYIGGTDAWFNNIPSDSQVSAHYGVALDGRVHQYVGEDKSAWANGILEAGNTWPYHDGVNPNWRTISIETEDAGSSGIAVSAAQYNAVLQLCTGIAQRWPSVVYLMAHHVISPQSRAGCPGPRWTSSGKLQAIAERLNLTLML